MGLMFANDFAGIPKTPEGLQMQIAKALKYSTKWRMAANVNKCAAVVCNEERENPVTFAWKREEA